MANPVWPSVLSQRPLIDGFNSEFHDPLLSTQMQSGVTRMRRQFTKPMSKQSVRYRMKGTDYTNVFYPFVKDTIKSGSMDFDIPVWNGSSMVVKSCQMVGGQFQTSMTGRYVDVSFTLLVRDL
jgi:hypothetical protein